jgi:hypothetical protein
MLLSLAVIVLIVLIGTGLTTWMSGRLRFEERVAIGAAAGALVVSVISLVAFVAIGMSWGSLAIGLAVPGIAALVGVRRQSPALRTEFRSTWRRLGQPISHPTSLRPFALFTVAAGAVATRMLSLSYQTTPDGLSAGSLAVWGDWSAHLAYAGSFAHGDNRSFDLPIASGHPFGYHFLADFFGSIFTVSGATLPQALVVSDWLLAVAFAPLLWCAVIRLTRSRLTAGLTVALFTLSGGIGLWYFAADVERDGWSIITSLPRTYARIPEQHLWVDNVISASLYAQRSTLLGLTVGFAALILILVSRPSGARAGFFSAGVLVGFLGIGHGHTLLTALALAVIALIADRRRIWWWFIVPAAVIGLPLAAAILPETSSIRWMIGWMAPDSGQPWPWFWFRNVGLLLPLFAWLSLMGGVSHRLRRLTAPLWLWFVVPNLIAFHPSEWNNTKYFLYWQLAGSLVIASWMSGVLRRHQRDRTGRRVAVQSVVVITLLAMISAGTLDTVRAMQRSTAIAWVTDDDLAAAEWLRDNSRPDDVIAYGMTNTSAAAALGGRRALSGYIGWTYDLGLADWNDRWAATRTILSGGNGASEAVERHGVDYVVIGPEARAEHDASDEYWATNGRLVFDAGEHRIYAVN